LPSKHTNIIPVVSAIGLSSKDLHNKPLDNMSFFQFGLHPYKLATLRATMGLIITTCYCINLSKSRICYFRIAYCYVTKRLWPAIDFLMWKWPAKLKRLGRPGLGWEK